MKLCYNVLFFLLLIGREIVGTVTLKQVYEIAKIKKQDSSMKNVPLESLCKSIIGSSRSMGIEIVPGRDADTWRLACVSLLRKCTYILWIVTQSLLSCNLPKNSMSVTNSKCYMTRHVDGQRAWKKRVASRTRWKWMKNMDCRAEFQLLTPIATSKILFKMALE